MIRAVVRALAVFDVFDKDHLSLSLQEIGQRLQMPKATTFRLVNTLQRAGFLVRLENQQYCLSHKLTRLAGLVLASVSLRDMAKPIMKDVNNQTGETITLNIIDGSDRICIDAVDTPSPLMSIARPGERIPLLNGATSRILLAYLPSEERDRILADIPEAASVDRDSLEKELKQFRRQGYALTRSQRVQGVTAIGVPIWGEGGKVRECLALTGPSARVDDRESEFVEIMLAAGKTLSEMVGGYDDSEFAEDQLEPDTRAPAAKKTAARKRPAKAAANKAAAKSARKAKASPSP